MLDSTRPFWLRNRQISSFWHLPFYNIHGFLRHVEFGKCK